MDYYRFSAGIKPLFGIPVHNPGEAATYIGLGYKVVSKSANVSELVTLFGRQRNLSLMEKDIQHIEDYLAGSDVKHDKAKNFASFQIYGHSFLAEDMVEIYMWVVKQTFFPQHGSIIEEGCSSIPCVVTVDLANGGLSVAEIRYPRDGTLYAQDVKEMFPAWVEYRIRNVHRTNITDRLAQENTDKARQYFLERGY